MQAPAPGARNLLGRPSGSSRWASPPTRLIRCTHGTTSEVEVAGGAPSPPAPLPHRPIAPRPAMTNIDQGGFFAPRPTCGCQASRHRMDEQQPPGLTIAEVAWLEPADLG